MIENPFILEPYKSKDLFCDRETETEELISNLSNGRSTTLISPRRLGKTGLILRTFDEIKTRKLPFETVYVDISDTSSVEDFIKVFSEAIAAKLKKQNRVLSFLKSMQNVRPLLGIDPISGTPQVSFTFANENQKITTLADLLNYLESNFENVVVAIDEFQQIREYGSVNMEAVLRKHIQHLHNVRFIYCGSKKHTMSDMFTNAKSPFYESTSFVYLTKLSAPVYSDFIRNCFESRDKVIASDAVDYIMEWTRGHTYYTQRLCNEVFARTGHAAVKDDVLSAISSILNSEQERFMEIRRLITSSQWKMLKAIAEEGRVSSITSSAFLSRHGISSGATALRNIKALVEKELVLVETTEAGTQYSVYNVFLSRYLER